MEPQMTHPTTSSSPSSSAPAPAPYRLIPMKYSGEDILFCVDVGPESAVQMKPKIGGAPCSRLEAIMQAIILFVNSKLAINTDHRFAYAALSNSAGWIKKEFTRDVDVALAVARTLTVDPTPDRADLTNLFKAAAIEARKSRSQARVLRVVLFYCRSSLPPEFERIPKLQKLFTLDVIYLHDKPLADKNCPQKVYDALVDALEYVGEYEGYIYESGKGQTHILFRYMCQLLSHPQQRWPQDEDDVPKSITNKKLQATDIVPVDEAFPMSISQ